MLPNPPPRPAAPSFQGWYQNNCKCNGGEKWRTYTARDYDADAAFVVAGGFGGVKVDGCGPMRDVSQVAARLLAHKVLLEDCLDQDHDPARGYWTPPTLHDLFNDSVSADGCPANLYRVCEDIPPTFLGTVYNLNKLSPYLDAGASRPGCWAYPDMLQVGNLRGPRAFVESRSHFAAWCVTSSPLVLGFDLTSQALEAMWPILSNRRMLAINQAWHGQPGRNVLNSSAYFMAPTAHGAGAKLGPAVRYPEWQVWAKPQAEGRVAVLFLNLADRPADASIELSALSLGARARGVDVYSGAAVAFEGRLAFSKVAPHDSVLLLLGPGASEVR